MIFAREVSDPLTSLVKKLDEAVVNNKSCRMGSFVVFCTDDEGLKDKLKSLAEKEQLKKVILTIDNPAGPTSYKVAKDADVTVVLYNKRKIEANFAFGKGEMKDADVDRIVQNLSKILPANDKEKK